MRYRIYIVTTSLLLAAGCASQTVWNKTGGTEAQFAKDRYQCMKETSYTEKNTLWQIGAAMQSAAAAGQGGPNPSGDELADYRQNRQMFEACMQSKGYRH